MRLYFLAFFSLFFFVGLHAQTVYQERTTPTNIMGISTYRYQIFSGTPYGVYYYNRLAFSTKQTPLVKVSPIGNEAFFLDENEIIKYNTIDFEVLQKENNKAKDIDWSQMISNSEGSTYFMNTVSGNLFELQADAEDLLVTPIPLDFFVSQMYWHKNLNQILVADDFYLQYLDPISKKTSNRIKLSSDITAINAHERKFLVTAGLSNGKLIVLDQTLTEIRYEKEISKASITSIIEDPLDHYLYIGDNNGTLFTFDLLKKEVTDTQQIHTGKIQISDVYEPLKNKKYLITTGGDNKLIFHTTSDLTPNYHRIVEKRITEIKETFLKIKSGESAVAYDQRVNDGRLKKLITENTSFLHDSIAQSKVNSSPVFDIENDSLSLVLKPFETVKIRLFKKIGALSELKLSNVHYFLKEDNSFEIKSFEIIQVDGDPIKFSSDRKTMRAYESEISLALAKKVAKKEVEFKTSLSDIVIDLRSDGKLNDVSLSVNSVLKKEKDSLGNDELNLHVTFMSQGIKAEIQKETADYPAGKYDIFDSQAATTLVGFFIKSSGEKLKEYLTNNRKITFKITGATDKSPISRALPYKEEYGAFYNFPYYFQGQLGGLIVNSESGIKENSQLGFLRTYAVRNFIENFSDVFDNTKRKYIHYSEEADAYGPEYRKIKIEVIIHKVDQIPGIRSKQMSKEDVSLSSVDINIPEGKTSNNYALVIGNEDYASFQRNVMKESNVPFAIRDAEVFKNYLHKLYGMPLENIDFLKNATFGEMSQAISRLERVMELDGADNDIVVFYSGHGMPEETTKEPYLIPVDINGTNVSQGISLKDLMKRLSEKPHRKISLVIDACFSGLGKNEPLVGLKGITIKPVNPELGDNMLLLSSSSGNESSVVDQENQHGLFTYQLLKILQKTEGNISIQDLYNTLRKDVGINAIKKFDKIQTPAILLGKNIKDKVGEVKIIAH